MMKRLIFLLLLSSACTSPPEKFKQRTQILMGTGISVVLPEKQADLHHQSFKIVKDLQQKLSTYDSTSEISRLNQSRALAASPVTMKALTQAVLWSRRTENYFHPGLGRWTEPFKGRGHEKAAGKASHLPAPFYESVRIINNKVFISDPNTQVDLGGIGKGFTVDQVSEFLEEQNVSDYIIKASGDIRCRKSCEFFIQNPFDADKKAGPFDSRIEHLAISTSGNYENYLENRAENHLLNPFNGKSQSVFASVTVLKEADNTGADALATAASVMPRAKAEKLLKDQGCAYVLILADGKTVFSPNFHRFARPRETR